MSKKPAYMDVYDDLKGKISGGVYEKGDMLPPEHELEKMFAVSRTTIRKAVEILARDGYVRVKQGYGTQVVSRKTTQVLNYLTSLTQTLEAKGYAVGVGSMYMEQVAADESLAEDLHINVGAPLVCINRIQLANQSPIAITKNYILPQLVPDILQNAGKIVSLYQYLKDTYGLAHTSAMDFISASNASFEEAALLGVEPKSALICVRRICFLNEKPVEADMLKIVAAKYEFEVFLQGR